MDATGNIHIKQINLVQKDTYYFFHFWFLDLMKILEIIYVYAMWT